MHKTKIVSNEIILGVVSNINSNPNKITVPIKKVLIQKV